MVGIFTSWSRELIYFDFFFPQQSARHANSSPKTEEDTTIKPNGASGLEPFTVPISISGRYNCGVGFVSLLLAYLLWQLEMDSCIIHLFDCALFSLQYKISEVIRQPTGMACLQPIPLRWALFLAQKIKQRLGSFNSNWGLHWTPPAIWWPWWNYQNKYVRSNNFSYYFFAII